MTLEQRLNLFAVAVGHDIKGLSSSIRNISTSLSTYTFFGSFYDTTTQTNIGVTGINLVTYNTLNTSNGVDIISSGGKSSRITFYNSGTYNLSVDLLFSKSGNNNIVSPFSVWFSKNGNDISTTTTKHYLYFSNQNIQTSRGILVDMNANDYIEIKWASSDSTMYLNYDASGSNPTTPAAPSVFLNVNQILNTQLGATGATGVNSVLSVGTVISASPGTSASIVNVGTSQSAIFNFTIPIGNTGSTGSAATISLGSVSTGIPGSTVSITNSGTSQSSIFNFTIPRGSTGGTGSAATISLGSISTGAPGSSAVVSNSGTSQSAIFNFTIPSGVTGATGVASSISIGSVTTGAPGSSAVVSNSGTSQSAVLNFTIPSGVTGSTGTSANISIGSVTTGTPGSSAVVSNSGTSQSAIFNFTIPSGVTGSTGSTGLAASVSLGSVSTGIPGSTVSITNSGTSQSAIFNFTIPRGSTGGTGTNANISIGSVVTGSPGSNVVVSNSGTSQSAVLNFTIPSGVTGSTGTSANISIGSVTTGSASVINSGSSQSAVLDFTLPVSDSGYGPSNATPLGYFLNSTQKAYRSYLPYTLTTSLITTAYAAEIIWYQMFYMNPGSLINEIAMRVNTAGAAGLGSATLSVYIYRSKLNSSGGLIAGDMEKSCGSFSTLTTGAKIITGINHTLSNNTIDNIWWIAFRNNSTNTISLRSHTATDVPSWYMEFSTSNSQSKVMGYYQLCPYTSSTPTTLATQSAASATTTVAAALTTPVHVGFG